MSFALLDMLTSLCRSSTTLETQINVLSAYLHPTSLSCRLYGSRSRTHFVYRIPQTTSQPITRNHLIKTVCHAYRLDFSTCRLNSSTPTSTLSPTEPLVDS
ncbi:hypothetical protein RSAG8_05634, partial [Rhizoctonia solani AG-8 WAC10335]